MKTDAPTQPSLVRGLGPLMAIALVVGTVIGSGVFKKPQSIACELPEFGLVAAVWILGGVLAILGALALAEVATLYPRSGGNYVFLREGFGRLFGFLWGWVEFWMIRCGSIAALATVFTESLCDILGSQAPGFWPQKWLTAGVILGLALINVLGVRWGGSVQFLITLVKVGSLLGILVLPFVIVPATPGAEPQVANLQPIWPGGWDQFHLGRFTTALLGVLWAYHGWMNIAPVAEEVKHPQRNIPLALLAGTGIVMFLYLGANLAYALVMPSAELAAVRGDTTVVAAFTEKLLGPLGAKVAAAAVMISVFGALNGNLLVGPRLLYAMGEDGLAPRALHAVHPRFRTPALAILVLALWSCTLVLGSAAMKQYGLPTFTLGSLELDLNLPAEKPLFDVLTDYAMFGAVIFETMAVVTIFVFRWKYPDAVRPYRCLGYPIVPALYVILPALILRNMFSSPKGRAEAMIGVGFIALGVLVYYAAGLNKTQPTVSKD